jgi:nitronate monooxygenase
MLRFVGLIHDVSAVADLIDRIMADAERLIRDRLMGLLGDAAMPAARVA